MKLSASIYAFADAPLRQTVEALERFGVDYLHVDCNDDPGVFDDIATLREMTSLPIDLHVIAPEPNRLIPLIKAARPALCCFQIEPVSGTLALEPGIAGRLGLALSLGTDPSVITPYRSMIDYVLLMTTTPGQSGGVFDPACFEKINEVRAAFPELVIHVDGGVTSEVSFALRNMGVRCAVSGSFLSKHETLGRAVLSVRQDRFDQHLPVASLMMPSAQLPLLTDTDPPPDLRAMLAVIEAGKMGFVLLTDETNRLTGVVTDGDIRRALLSSDGPIRLPAPEQVINRKPWTVSPEMTIDDMLEVARRMPTPPVFLPVVDGAGVLHGCVSFSQLIRGEL